MKTKLFTFFFLCASGLSGPIPAQDSAPLSAIDWLSDSIARPRAPLPDPLGDGDVAQSALRPPVTTLALDAVLPDTIGLVSGREFGFPDGIWGATPSTEIVRLIAGEPRQMPVSLARLERDLLQAALDPPFDADADMSLYLARVDRLLELGELALADALLAKGPMDEPDVFRRRFDIALLLGRETEACREIQRIPEFSPTYPARIFCLARLGDWNAAALTLESANAIGILTPEQDHLLARFLDPELLAGVETPEPPDRISPLTFRLYESIGEPIPTEGLPRAFAHADIRPTRGWKAQIMAAERLAESGAVSGAELIALYRARTASASGGIWERVQAVQSLEHALRTGEDVGPALQRAWGEMQSARLEMAFAEVYGPRLAQAEIPPNYAGLALEIALLGADAKTATRNAEPTNDQDKLLLSIVRGDDHGTEGSDPLHRAIHAGLYGKAPSDQMQLLIDQDRRGEALLLAISEIAQGSFGDYAQLSDGLAVLRALGLSDYAREIALELMIVERNG